MCTGKILLYGLRVYSLYAYTLITILCIIVFHRGKTHAGTASFSPNSLLFFKCVRLVRTAVEAVPTSGLQSFPFVSQLWTLSACFPALDCGARLSRLQSLSCCVRLCLVINLETPVKCCGRPEVTYRAIERGRCPGVTLLRDATRGAWTLLSPQALLPRPTSPENGTVGAGTVAAS